MGFYLDKQGNYYQGDKSLYSDIEVPERPSGVHTWNGKEWVIDEVKKAAEAVHANKTKLTETDQGMIRVIDDLLTALLATNKLKIENLPAEAYNKYLERIELRKKILK